MTSAPIPAPAVVALSLLRADVPDPTPTREDA
jgi:hypothetical protein